MASPQAAANGIIQRAIVLLIPCLTCWGQTAISAGALTGKKRSTLRIQELEFWDSMCRYWASNNVMALHCSTVNHFDEVYEVLLQCEDSKPLGIVRRAKINFHVLCVEQEDNARKQGDVKVFDILWYVLGVDAVETGHFGEGDACFFDLANESHDSQLPSPCLSTLLKTANATYNIIKPQGFRVGGGAKPHANHLIDVVHDGIV